MEVHEPITEEELEELEKFAHDDINDGGWLWTDKILRLIAEVRRLRPAPVPGSGEEGETQ